MPVSPGRMKENEENEQNEDNEDEYMPGPVRYYACI